MEALLRFLQNEKVKNELQETAAYFTVLLYWELLLYFQLHSSFKGFTFWNILFLIPVALFMHALSGLFENSRLNSFVSVILLGIVSLFYVVDLIYFKTFGSLLSASMLGTGKSALSNFGWSLVSTIKENILLIIVFELPVFVSLYLAIRKRFTIRHQRPIVRLSNALIAYILWAFIVAMLPVGGTAAHSAYGAYHSRYVDTDTASRKLGVVPNFLVELKYSWFGYGDNTVILQAETQKEFEVEEEVEEVSEVIEYNRNEALDFSKLKDLSNTKTLETLCSYLNSVTPTMKNDYTGMFKDYNLIYICAESFSSLAIDEKITPTLYKLANNGIVLDNYYNSFKNVTTNGEYAFLSGLWPDVARQNTNMGNISGTMGQSIRKDMSFALGNMFNEAEGITSRAYHNYYGNYYGRNQTLPNMGFTCKFMSDGMKFTTAWPSSDLEMMEQSVDDYINDDQFCAYYMTFSGHGNYTESNVMVRRNIKTVTELNDGKYTSSAIGYLSANYELEKAMTYLLERLEEAGRLDKTVIVLTGDHYPYYLTEAGYESLKGEKFDPDFESFRSTCIIYNSGLKNKIEVDTPCCNVDILPTIYNLFDIPYDSRLYAGTDIFGNGAHIAQLYNRSFVTDMVRYNYPTGEAEWLIDTEGYSDELLESYLNNMINVVNNRYAMSIEIEESDFYNFVNKNTVNEVNTVQLNVTDNRNED